MPNYYLPPTVAVPSSLLIANITTSSPMQVTVSVGNVSEANTYIVGMAVRLFVPITYGMFQANNLIGTIIAINDSTFTLGIDSSQFDPFMIPAGGVESPASIAPSGSRNLQYNNSNVNFVPFRSLNNIGN